MREARDASDVRQTVYLSNAAVIQMLMAVYGQLLNVEERLAEIETSLRKIDSPGPYFNSVQRQEQESQTDPLAASP